MQSGFNTNIRHRGVLFHVQTEDSGKSNPHVITHLFHGGNIMASEKHSYSDELGSPDIEARVRKQMESQHKAMLKGLRAGLHDDAILMRVGPEAFEGAASADFSSTAATLPPEARTPTEAVASSAKSPAARRLPGAFGDAVVSEKPLDQVVLDYLVENARKRKQRAK
jgi:hypothetical protein